jgi:hypothetical protein
MGHGSERLGRSTLRAPLKVFTCDDHVGHWGVPTGSVVVARDEEEARALLTAELREHGLKPEGHRMTLKPVEIGKPGVVVLSDGEY